LSCIVEVRGETMNEQTQTIIETSKGTIQVVHEITLGDVILGVVLMAMLIFMVLERLTRRY
jgi:hypothetical protein